MDHKEKVKAILSERMADELWDLLFVEDSEIVENPVAAVGVMHMATLIGRAVDLSSSLDLSLFAPVGYYPIERDYPKIPPKVAQCSGRHRGRRCKQRGRRR